VTLCCRKRKSVSVKLWAEILCISFKIFKAIADIGVSTYCKVSSGTRCRSEVATLDDILVEHSKRVRAPDSDKTLATPAEEPITVLLPFVEYTSREVEVSEFDRMLSVDGEHLTEKIIPLMLGREITVTEPISRTNRYGIV
jgi:hypothetical protein